MVCTSLYRDALVPMDQLHPLFLPSAQREGLHHLPHRLPYIFSCTLIRRERRADPLHDSASAPAILPIQRCHCCHLWRTHAQGKCMFPSRRSMPRTLSITPTWRRLVHPLPSPPWPSLPLPSSTSMALLLSECISSTTGKRTLPALTL